MVGDGLSTEGKQSFFALFRELSVLRELTVTPSASGILLVTSQVPRYGA